MNNNPLSDTDPTGHRCCSLKRLVRSITHAVSGVVGWQVHTAQSYVNWQVRAGEKAAHSPYLSTVASIGFTFAGMPYMGAFMGSAIGTVQNHGDFGDFLTGYGVGSIAGFASGPASGYIATSAGMDLAGPWTALMRGAVGGGIGGGLSAGIYGQDVSQGITRGATGGAVVGGIVWSYYDYRTTQFINNNVNCGGPCSAEMTQTIREVGQSPVGQQAFAKYAGSGTTLNIIGISEANAHGYGNTIEINPDINAIRYLNAPAFNQLNTMTLATVVMHELGHTSLLARGPTFEAMIDEPYTVGRYENPYRAWIGSPPRTGYFSDGDVAPYSQ